MPDPAPMFSIVVCCWNSARYLRDNIASVQAQTLQDLEVVFVDGGSTDGTLEIIAETLPGSRVLHGIRGGISRAMNAGIEASRGRYVAHLHSDDYYASPRTLEAVAAAFAAQPERTWLFGRFYNDRDGAVAPPDYPARRYSPRALLRRNLVPHCATFVRRTAFDEVGRFDERLKLAMDYDLWLRLARRHEPIQLDDYLGVFRRHSDSATSANAMKSFNEDFKVRFKHAPAWAWPEMGARYVVRRLKDVR